jgi:hypothetical protein
MPDPERLLRTLRAAVNALRTTPGRRGHVVWLEQVDEVLVVGDLHGNLENLRQLLLLANLGKHPRRHLVLQELVHGPFRYAGGGDKSHQLVDLLAALKCQYPRQVHCLLGNHELAQWTGQQIAKANHELNDLFRVGVDTAYRSRAEEVYQGYLDMWAHIPVAVRTPNRVFLSHSLPGASRLAIFDPAVLEQEEIEPRELRPGGVIHSLVWGRDTRADTACAFLRKVDADWLISGHIPSEGGFAVPNNRQLIVDAMGAAAGYCLFPTSRPVTHGELVGSVKLIPHAS